MKEELEREIQRNLQLRAKNGKLTRDLSSNELKVSRLRNDLVAASAIIDSTKLKLVLAEEKCKNAERELDTVQKDMILDHASLDLERKQMAGKLEEAEKDSNGMRFNLIHQHMRAHITYTRLSHYIELRTVIGAKDRRLDVLTAEMEKLRNGEEDKELKILSLEDLCGVKERELVSFHFILYISRC